MRRPDAARRACDRRVFQQSCAAGRFCLEVHGRRRGADLDLDHDIHDIHHLHLHLDLDPAADQSGFWVSAEGELNPVPATPTAPNASAGLFGNGNDRLYHSPDGRSWTLIVEGPDAPRDIGTNVITPRGIVRAYVPYPPACSPPGDPCLQDVRIATLDWSASAWKTGDVVGATLAQAPVLRAVGDVLVLVLVDDSGLVTLTRSNDTTAWTPAPDATLAIGHAVDVSAATNTTSIVIVVHDTVASFLVGRCITQSCRR